MLHDFLLIACGVVIGLSAAATAVAMVMHAKAPRRRRAGLDGFPGHESPGYRPPPLGGWLP